ncbi:MAG TPA: hypothetical protein VGI83_05020 [Gemmatimonadales bacterium]|jgi:hypothetical protein
MSVIGDPSTRREFVATAGRMVSAVALTGGAAHSAHLNERPAPGAAAGDWDLSWLDRLKPATDRAIFDWPSLGDPADPIMLELAARYLDNCAAAYGATPYQARIVINIRTQAVSAGLNDAAWARESLGVEYGTKDPTTQQPATHNPFWHQAPSPAAGVTLPSLQDMVQRGAIVLVCDFAMTNLAKRLAAKTNRDAAEVHRSLRASLVPEAFAVPSGIFGLVKAQNAGCALVRV